MIQPSDFGLDLRPTPLEYCPGLSSDLGIDLFVKRDDLLGGLFGGSKVRIVHSILERAGLRGEEWDGLVTTGGVQSNLARVVAITSARLNRRCDLVLHNEEEFSDCGHLRLLQLLGANTLTVASEGVAEAIEELLFQYRSHSLRPLFIPGGGHTVDGAVGFVEAAQELLSQEDDLGIRSRFIVHASGTGGTQAGITCGLALYSDVKKRVLGISVARKNPRGKAVVEQLASELATELETCSPEIEFFDQWTSGGYMAKSAKVFDTIHYAARTDGLLLDPVYTGKAFWGLLEMVETGTIPKGSQVVFWHTGGGINLMTSLEETIG